MQPTDRARRRQSDRACCPWRTERTDDREGPGEEGNALGLPLRRTQVRKFLGKKMSGGFCNVGERTLLPKFGEVDGGGIRTPI